MIYERKIMPDESGERTGLGDYGRAVNFNYFDFRKASSTTSHDMFIDKPSEIRA